MQNDPIPIASLVYFNRSKAYLDCGVDSEKNKRYIFSGPWYNNTPQSPLEITKYIVSDSNDYQALA